jgi:hypothetical protein
MPNGKIGDNPITDLLLHGKHPFPSDIESMLRQIHALNPSILHELNLEPFHWEKGQNLDDGHRRLKELIARHGT